MYCPKCGHQQSSETQRYCSRCGLLLDGVADLLSGSEDRMELEKREVLGISLVLSTLFILLIYFTVFGVAALPHIPNRGSLLTVWLLFLCVSLGLGGGGIIALAKSGFFKKLKARQLRVQLAQLEKRKRDLEAQVVSKTGRLLEDKPAVRTAPTSPADDFISITETTTRNLEESREHQ